MRQINLQNMTLIELIDHFAGICIAQDRALLYNEISNLNHLILQMKQVDTELRARGKDARIALRKLYDHPNMQVRLQAARITLGVAPQAARQVIQSISESHCFAQAGDAGMTLSLLDKGNFKPD